MKHYLLTLSFLLSLLLVKGQTKDTTFLRHSTRAMFFARDGKMVADCNGLFEDWHIIDTVGMIECALEQISWQYNRLDSLNRKLDSLLIMMRPPPPLLIDSAWLKKMIHP